MKRSVILGFNTLSKKRAKNYITKAVKKRLSRSLLLLLLFSSNGRKEKEREREYIWC